MQAMDEKMKFMLDMMPPKSGMNMKDHDEWMMEHQKHMQMMMDQMKREHDLMMKTSRSCLNVSVWAHPGVARRSGTN